MVLFIIGGGHRALGPPDGAKQQAQQRRHRTGQRMTAVGDDLHLAADVVGQQRLHAYRRPEWRPCAGGWWGVSTHARPLPPHTARSPRVGLPGRQPVGRGTRRPVTRVYGLRARGRLIAQQRWRGLGQGDQFERSGGLGGVGKVPRISHSRNGRYHAVARPAEEETTPCSAPLMRRIVIERYGC